LLLQLQIKNNGVTEMGHVLLASDIVGWAPESICMVMRTYGIGIYTSVASTNSLGMQAIILQFLFVKHNSYLAGIGSRGSNQHVIAMHKYQEKTFLETTDKARQTLADGNLFFLASNLSTLIM
jgi:hypothetical protein